MINIIQSIQIPKHVKKNNNNHNNNNKKLTNKNKNCYHSWHLAASIICKGNTREILEKSARNPRENERIPRERTHLATHTQSQFDGATVYLINYKLTNYKSWMKRERKDKMWVWQRRSIIQEQQQQQYELFPQVSGNAKATQHNLLFETFC